MHFVLIFKMIDLENIYVIWLARLEKNVSMVAVSEVAKIIVAVVVVVVVFMSVMVAESGGNDNNRSY